MSVHCLPRQAPRAARERGQAMLLTVLLLAVGIASVVYNFVTPARVSIERDKITAAALAQAKAALIGYALSVDVTPVCAGSNCPRIGDLPCPDLDNDGDAEGSCGNTDGSTGQNQRLGRLPWKTLGLPDLRDGYGERLWYAVSNNFKNNFRADCSALGTATCRNSDIRGTITVRDQTGSPVHDGTNPSAAIAIIFAPGPVLRRLDGTVQDRLLGQNNPVNYLDLANVGGNEDNANFVDSDTNGFINGPVFDASGNIVNDRLSVIRYDDILPLMERRVAGEVLKCLTSYASDNGGRYPWAAPLFDTTPPYGDVMTVTFGRVPDPPFAQTNVGQYSGVTIGGVYVPDFLNGQTACSGGPLCMRTNWPPSCNLSAGTWWLNWKDQVFYVMGSGFKPALNDLPSPLQLTQIAPTGTCPSSNCLSVNPPTAAPDYRVVVMAAGRRLLTQGARPSANAADYLELTNTTSADAVFTKQPRSATFNDTVVYTK